MTRKKVLPLILVSVLLIAIAMTAMVAVTNYQTSLGSTARVGQHAFVAEEFTPTPPAGTNGLCGSCSGGGGGG